MATTLPAKLGEYTPLQAQSTYTEAEKAAFDELYAYISQHTKATMWWYWDLGQKVAKIYKDAQSKKELYGKQVLFRLGIGLGFKTEHQLRNSMEVCASFGTKKAFTEYVKLQGEAGNRLSWSHIVYLAGIGDTDLRMQLAAASLEHTWTAEELWAKVKELCERRSRGIRTPTTKVPTSARGCLTHVFSQAQKFVFNHDNAWTGDAFDLPATVKDIPADKLSDKLLAAVREAKTQVTKLQERATKMEKLLSGTETDIVARMAAQATLEAQQAVEMAEAAGTESPDSDAVSDADNDGDGVPLSEADNDGDGVPLSEARNAAARAKRAAIAKRKKGKKGPTRPGRVGTNR